MRVKGFTLFHDLVTEALLNLFRIFQKIRINIIVIYYLNHYDQQKEEKCLDHVFLSLFSEASWKLEVGKIYILNVTQKTMSFQES